MNIPKKNIRRWLDLGAERKKGGGRKRLDEVISNIVDYSKWNPSYLIGVSRRAYHNIDQSLGCR